MTNERRMGGPELEGVSQHKDAFARVRAPYRNAEISLIDKPDSEVPLMELRIREGRRITLVELDAETVAELAAALRSWADDNAKS